MFLFSKISVIIFFILIVTIIAELFGILEPKYSNYIFFAGILAQIIILACLLILTLIRKRELSRGVKIIRYKIEDKYIKGGTEILPSFIGATNPIKASIFKIFVETDNVKEYPDLGIIKMGKGRIMVNDLKKHLLNIRSGIVEGSFIFDVDMIVRPDERINFTFKNDINVKRLFVGELYIP